MLKYHFVSIVFTPLLLRPIQYKNNTLTIVKDLKVSEQLNIKSISRKQSIPNKIIFQSKAYCFSMKIDPSCIRLFFTQPIITLTEAL